MKKLKCTALLICFLAVKVHFGFAQPVVEPATPPATTLATQPQTQAQPLFGGTSNVVILPVHIESPYMSGAETLLLQDKLENFFTNTLSNYFMQVYSPSNMRTLIGSYVFSPLVQEQRKALTEKAKADLYVNVTLHCLLQEVDSKDAFAFAKQAKIVTEDEKPAKEGKSLKWNVKDYWIYKPWLSFDIQIFSVQNGNMVKRYQENGLTADGLMVNANQKDDSVTAGFSELSRMLFPQYLSSRLLPEMVAFDEALLAQNKDNFVLLDVLAKNYSQLSQLKDNVSAEFKKATGFAENLTKLTNTKKDPWSVTEAGIIYRSYLYPASEDKTTKKRDTKLLDTAMKFFLDVTKNSPSYRYAHFNLAGCYREKEMVKEAVDEYKKFLRLAGWANGAEEARNYLAQVFGKDKKLENLYAHSVLAYKNKTVNDWTYEKTPDDNQNFTFKSDAPLGIFVYWNFADKVYDASLKIYPPKGALTEDKFQTEKDKIASFRPLSKEGAALEKGNWKVDVLVAGKKADTLNFTVQ